MGKALKDLCRRCGGKCCRCHSSVLLDKDEDTGRLEELEARIVDDKSFGLTMVFPGGTCQFLVDGRCSIYEDRPWACIEFDCTDPRRRDSAVFDDFPEHRKAVEEALKTK